MHGGIEIKFGSIYEPKILFDVNFSQGCMLHGYEHVSHSELTQCILGCGVFSYSRILSNSFVELTVIHNLYSYANTPVWKVL